MRALVAGLAAGLVTLAIVKRPGAQPADFARAKSLYDAANGEMSSGKYLDAVRDYTAAYDITHDPVLFFKIGNANEQAGKCDVALIYYSRYVREATPEARFLDMVKERITACGGDARNLGAPAGTGSGSAAAPLPTIAPDQGSGAGSAATPDVGAGVVTLGSDAPRARVHGHDGAWLMIGGALAFVTVGIVLAYSANSSEQDIRDLYVDVDGVAPTYNATTAQRYQDLVDEGHRYQDLALGSFGVAVGFAVGAAIWFIHDRNVEALAITPVASAQTVGINAVGHF